MLQKYLLFLKRFDDPDHWEQPPNFDRTRAKQKAETFSEDLKSRIRVSLGFESGDSIQDAAFHSQIHMSIHGEVVSLRFSNFGDLVALMGEAAVPAALLDKIKSLLGFHGYTFIPEFVLEEPYTGVNRSVGENQDWWVRYFDWIGTARFDEFPTVK